MVKIEFGSLLLFDKERNLIFMNRIWEFDEKKIMEESIEKEKVVGKEI